jgi:Sulfotransferase domain
LYQCDACGISFDDAMLKWPKGPKPCDGVWASHWYNAVWQSEGFGARNDKAVELPSHLQAISDQALPIYNEMKRHAITA